MSTCSMRVNANGMFGLHIPKAAEPSMTIGTPGNSRRQIGSETIGTRCRGAYRLQAKP